MTVSIQNISCLVPVALYLLSYVVCAVVTLFSKHLGTLLKTMMSGMDGAAHGPAGFKF
jgi:hypothetical protein